MKRTAVLLALWLCVGCAQDIERERRCRLAVRSLVAAPERKVRGELEKVVAYGRYALVDIEQELHGAPARSRTRLLKAIERIGEREALPLVQFLARWDSDDAVRGQAASLARRWSKK